MTHSKTVKPAVLIYINDAQTTAVLESHQIKNEAASHTRTRRNLKDNSSENRLTQGASHRSGYSQINKHTLSRGLFHLMSFNMLIQQRFTQRATQVWMRVEMGDARNPTPMRWLWTLLRHADANHTPGVSRGCYLYFSVNVLTTNKHHHTTQGITRHGATYYTYRELLL